MHWTLIIGFIGTALGIMVNVPQALKIKRSKDAKSVSVWTYRLLLIVVICYFIRAVHIREWVFIISNGTAVFVTSWVLLLIHKHK